FTPPVHPLPTLFPYTTLFRSLGDHVLQLRELARDAGELLHELRRLGRGRARGLFHRRARRFDPGGSRPEKRPAPGEHKRHRDQRSEERRVGKEGRAQWSVVYY